jgi:mannose-1-phosphate guanylyltransferase
MLVYTSGDKLVVVSGMQDAIVVCEEDVVLIFPKDREQEIKALREQFKLKGFDKFL